MQILLAILAFASPAPQAFAQEPPSAYAEYQGKTFTALGPNCFATATKVTGVSRSFRGMDEPEFRAITRLFCEKTENPKLGDIGVFEIPKFGFTHAYAYVSPEYGLEKPGVDYAGQTPISMDRTEVIMYRFLASPECRRYSKDISLCSSDHYFLRCNPVTMRGNAWAKKHDERVKHIEEILSQFLETANFGAEGRVIFQRVELEAQNETALLAKQSDLPPELNTYLRARMVSLTKQIQFLRPKF